MIFIIRIFPGLDENVESCVDIISETEMFQ